MGEDIVVVGGGVAGLATALALHRVGLRSLVLERADSLRTAGAALIMWPNAWKALDSLGAAHALRPRYSLLDGIRGCSNCSGVQKDLQLKERGGSSVTLECRCTERIALLEALARELPEGSIRFNSKIIALTRNRNNPSPLITLGLADGTSLTAKIVIGCDGVHSLVAKWMGFPAAKSAGRVAFRGMATYDHSHHLDSKLMVQIWGKGLKSGFITCTDKQIYWFVTRRLQPQDAEICGDLESVRGAALEMVRDFPEPIAEVIKSSPAETINLAELKVRWLWPWEWEWGRGKGSVTIAGDALHPMTPDLGQGACLALEDAVLLGRCLGEAMKTVNMAHWGEAEVKIIESCFNKYLHQRRWRVSAIICAAFIIGIVQEGSSKLTRFVRDWIFFPLFSLSYLLYFARY